MTNAIYNVPAIDNVMKIMHFLSTNNTKGLTLTEICKNTDLNRSTSFRLLQSLLKYNLVSYDSYNKEYKLGHLLIYLGGKASEVLNNINNIQPFLLQAAKRTGQTAILTQLYGESDLIYIAKEESLNDHRINVNTGQIRPLNGLAAGKMFLACKDQDELEKLLSSQDYLKTHTPKTITDETVFIEELRVIAKRGYSISHEEYKPGISGVAAPIYDSNQNVSFVIFISCFTAQVTEEELHQYGGILKSIASEISRFMGA